MWKLPTIVPDDIKRVWNIIKGLTDLEHEEKIKLFFKLALQGYYSPMTDGMKGDAGHIIYRLSDHLTLEERLAIEVYPYITLEGWRIDWERHHPQGIPIITVKLLTP